MGKAVEQPSPTARSRSEQAESTWDDLSRVRDGWQEIEAEETRLLSQMTIQDSLQKLLALQRAFELHLQQTEALFRAERLAYLEELQHRLARLDE
jgi:DNA-binding IscR family transcriptional regulator